MCNRAKRPHILENEYKCYVFCEYSVITTTVVPTLWSIV